MDETEFVARALGVHFVAVTCRRRPADPSQPETRPVISGFLADIDGHWFYVTAGHVLRDVDAAIRQGVTFDQWQFDDQTAGHRFAFTHVPFAFERAEWLDIYELGMDYAALPLRDLYREQLKAGGAQPLPEHTWSNHGVYHDHWFLLGIPNESLKMRPDGNLSARTVGIALQECDPPEEAEDRGANVFYGRLAKGSEAVAQSIEGASGGPIFGLKRDERGNWKYWVIGVQSKWFAGARVATICPFASFALALQRDVRTLQAQANAKEDHGSKP
jgi:hypothetical protein